MIFKLIFGIILIYLFYKLIRTWKKIKEPHKPDLPATGEDLVEDPLCHTYVPVSYARRVEIEGKTVYFCSEKCHQQYTLERKRQ